MGTGRFANDQQGSVFVEYLVLVGAVAIGVAVATVAIGIPLLHNYRFAQFIITLPIP